MKKMLYKLIKKYCGCDKRIKELFEENSQLKKELFEIEIAKLKTVIKEEEKQTNKIKVKKKSNKEIALKKDIIKNDNLEDDVKQTNTSTELRNWAVYYTGKIRRGVKNCNVKLEAENQEPLLFKSNAGGVVYSKIPKRLIGINVKATYSAEGFKNRVFEDVVFSKGKTKSFQVRMFKGVK